MGAGDVAASLRQPKRPAQGAPRDEVAALPRGGGGVRSGRSILIMAADMAPLPRAILDRCVKSASVHRVFACAARASPQDSRRGEIYGRNHRSADVTRARTYDPGRLARGAADFGVHRGERLSGAEGRADLCDVDSRGGDFDGAAALYGGVDDPRE